MAIWELASSPTRVGAWQTLGYLATDRWGATTMVSVATSWWGYWPDICAFPQSLSPALRAPRAVQPPQNVIMVGAGNRTEPTMVQQVMAVSVDAIVQRLPITGVHTKLAPPETGSNTELGLTSPRGAGLNLSQDLGD